MLFTYHQVTNAAREGARYAVAHGIEGTTQVNQGDYQAMIGEVSSRTSGLSADALSITAQWPGDASAKPIVVDEEEVDRCPPGGNNAGCPVRVAVTYTYEPVVAMFAGWGSFEMSSSSEMRIHY